MDDIINHPNLNFYRINRSSSHFEVCNYRMDEDTMMADQAMDIDGDAAPIPSTDGTSAVAPPSLLRARHSLPSTNENRRSHDSLRAHSGSRVRKNSPNTDTFPGAASFYADHRRMRLSATRNRNLRVQHAIINGTYEIRSINDPNDENSPPTVDQGEPEQLQRLDRDIVAQALYDPVPGMAFDPAVPSFDEADMQDLVQAAEAFQRHLARKGRVVLSDRAGALLRAFARDVMAVFVLQPKEPNYEVGSEGFWDRVATDYHWSKQTKYLTQSAMKTLASTGVHTAPAWARKVRFTAHFRMVASALENPGEHPMLDAVSFAARPQHAPFRPWPSILTTFIIQALAEAKEDMPPFVVAKPSTLRSLIGHFEAARSRYLANLNMSDGGQASMSIPVAAPKPAQGSGAVPRNNGRHDSSSDEDDDGARADLSDGGGEDNAQVEDGVASPHTKWLLVKLDHWIASKSGQQQGGADVDMLSALDLGGLN